MGLFFFFLFVTLLLCWQINTYLLTYIGKVLEVDEDDTLISFIHLASHWIQTVFLSGQDKVMKSRLTEIVLNSGASCS